jgi:hypothetical protein
MDMERIDDARRSRVLLLKLKDERLNVLITRLVADYRGDKLVHDKLVGAIAEIAGMTDQIDRLTREVSNG